MQDHAQRPMNFAGLAVAMTIGALGIVGINLYSDRSFVEESLLKRARAHARDIQLMQRWVSGYGGVYVEGKAGEAADPHAGARTVRTSDGRTLSLRDPAQTMRELSGLAGESGDDRTRMTSLGRTHPASAPDDWERAALAALGPARTEVFDRVAEGGRTLFRYLAPVYLEPACMSCHASEGARVGDLRGGISVAFDVSDTEAVFRDNAVATGVAVALILLGVGQLMLLGLRRVRAAGRDADRERARFESLVQTADGIVWEADAKTLTYTFVSNQAEAMLGYPLADWTRPGFWIEHVHPDDREWAAEYCMTFTRRREAHDFEYRFLAADGRVVWLHDLVGVVEEDGRPTLLRGLLLDVTRRKESELLARAVQAEQSAILNNVLVGIVYLRHRAVVTCNPRFEQLFGYAPGELVGCSTRVLYAGEDDFEAVGREAEQAVENRQAYSREVLLRKKNGQAFWGVITGQAIDPARPQEGSIWIYADISERKEAEDEAGKLLRAVEQSPVSIVITSRDGRIEYVNPRFTQVSGYTREEAIGRNPRFLKSGHTPPETYVDLWATLLAGREWRGTLSNLRKNGECFLEEASIAPVVNACGETTHFIAVKEDITERLQVDEELRQYRDNLETEVRARTADLVVAMQKATAADRAKSEFLTNMSHEMRTPLNAVIGFCRLAQRTALTAQQRDYLDKIDGAGQHLLELINNLLDLSKIAAGRVELMEAEFNPQHLMSRLSSVFGFKAAEKGVALRVAVAPEVPGRLLGDALRLNQVLLNLLANAVKFTEHGRIEVDVACVELGAERATLRFAIADTGIGMEAAELKRAFEPFAQGDASITRKYGGTGLGLAISRELVSLMGGQIEVSSHKGVGSRFGFTLEFRRQPAAAPVAETAPPERPLRYHFEGVRVLLVEDQPLNRQVAEELLAACGVEVESAADGREAVERVLGSAPGTFDLVLMDLQMPEFDGLSAIRAIRARAEFRTLPMVALTAHVLEEERLRSAAAGANDHLGKPFQPEQLYATVARWLPPAKVRREPAPPDGRAPASAGEVFGAASAVLDWSAGLERFDGQLDKYLGWLARFADERTAAVDEIETLLRADRADEAALKVHSLKGVSATLGLSRVFLAAQDLERMLGERADELAPPQLDGLRAALAEALAGVRDVLERRLPAGADPCAGADGSAAMRSGRLRLALARLDRMLGAGDAAAGEWADACLRCALGGALEAPLRAVVDAVGRNDLAAARERLRALRGSLAQGDRRPLAEIA